MRFSDLKKIFSFVYAAYAQFTCGQRFYQFTTAITAGTTTTSAPAGSKAVTSHATGKNELFVSDGSYWQSYYGQASETANLATIPTSAGNTDLYVIAPFTGVLSAALVSFIDALVQHATNIVTFNITNLGQDGSGSNAMLAATDANTTKTSTGTAIAAHTKRALTLHGTAGNLVVAQGDRIRIRVTGGGTLANTLTGGAIALLFQRTI